jgi:hypothetical protein
VSVLAGTPLGDQFPALNQSLLTAPVQVQVVCAKSLGEKAAQKRIKEAKG